ncbi:helix-turn-helix domain-containing protein [Amycolatopsis sp. WGS_07]|uniref:helix-turn-helix domain-containing protein n=1 Tax=Amycolatopsis sp. WGS_07 TaxID=3076764 RepID=UPI0038731ADB
MPSSSRMRRKFPPMTARGVRGGGATRTFYTSSDCLTSRRSPGDTRDVGSPASEGDGRTMGDRNVQGGQKLRQWRRDRGLTLREVQDLTGVSQSMLSRVERGQRTLAPLRRVHLSRCLRVRVDVLFDVADSKVVR